MAIIPLAEAVQRLESLDWATPTVDRPTVEKNFVGFLQTVSAKKSYDYKFRDGIDFYWVPGTHDYRSRLADEGVFASPLSGFRTAYWSYLHDLQRSLFEPQTLAVALRESQSFALLAAVSPALGFHQTMLRDSNLVDAVVAGLGGFIVQNRMVILFQRPVMRTRRERNRGPVLHSMIGPAVTFPNDPQSSQYWIRGVKVKPFVVEHPERITRAHIRAARTAELRRTLIEQYGLLKYCIERGFKPVDHNEKHGVTLYVKGGTRNGYGGTTFRECVIELINTTPEPDGTRRRFARRVPGEMRTAREAVAWTFELRPEEYDPAVQT